MLSGRPGPATLSMCWDTMAASYDVDIAPGNTAIEKPAVDPDAVKEAAGLVSGAKKIMIMCGGGAQHASEEVRELAEMLGASVTAFRSGRGVVAEDHACGTSSAAARILWQDTDLLIGIGSRLELQFMRWGSMAHYYDSPPPGSPKVIRIDVDPDEMTRFRPDVGIVADSVDGTRALIEEIGRKGHKKGDLERIAEAKKSSRSSVISTPFVMCCREMATSSRNSARSDSRRISVSPSTSHAPTCQPASRARLDSVTRQPSVSRLRCRIGRSCPS